jgi:large subunit ribosomal protein L7Ae
MSFIKFKVPEKLQEQIKNALSVVAEAKDGKIRKGMNEVTKSIERGNAKFVIMAEDVSPPEILFHVPLLCEEKEVPYAYITTKKALGSAVKINIGASSIVVENLGAGNDNLLSEIVKQLDGLKK